MLALSGCLKEHPGECDISENLEVLFTYSDAPNEDFTDRITSVDVILFNNHGRFLEHRRASLNELSAYAGMRFTVPSGRYHVVAWGNVRDNSVFNAFTSGVTMFRDCVLEIDPSSTETGDPIYYAPYREKPAARSGEVSTRDDSLAFYAVDVPPGRKTTKILDFVRAHRTLNVWIKGYHEIVAGQNVYPVVKSTDMWSKYDFFFTTQALRRNYTQQSHVREVNGVPYAVATFHTALGKIDGATDVILTRRSDGGHIITVNLEQFVTDNGITDTDEIDILITFFPPGGDYGVTVTVPNWSGAPVQPGT